MSGSPVTPDDTGRRRCVRCGGEYDAPDWHCPRCGFQPSEKDGALLFAPELQGGDEGYDVGLHTETLPLQAGHFWFRGRNRYVRWLLRRFAPPSPGRYFEIGCSNGFMLATALAALPEWRLEGAEMSLAAAAIARQRLNHRVEVHQMDATNLPFVERFDMVAAFDVLEHLDDDAAALGELHRALKEDGVLLLTVPQHRFLWSAFDEVQKHRRRYDGAEIRRRVEQAGFEVLFSSSYTSLILPLLYLSRRFGDREQSSAGRELHVNRVVNGVLDGVMALEYGLVRLGVRFPFGGSRLMVAKRRDAK